jgi:hypothetical protein
LLGLCKVVVYGTLGQADSFETLKHGITASNETITPEMFEHIWTEIVQIDLNIFPRKNGTLLT